MRNQFHSSMTKLKLFTLMWTNNNFDCYLKKKNNECVNMKPNISTAILAIWKVIEKLQQSSSYLVLYRIYNIE